MLVSRWTAFQQAVVSAALTFHNHVSTSEIVPSQLQQVLASNPQISFPSLSPADGECYQPISTFAYALPTGLHASHSRAPYLSTASHLCPEPSRWRHECSAIDRRSLNDMPRFCEVITFAIFTADICIIHVGRHHIILIFAVTLRQCGVDIY
jgi:hypothetical protein